MELEAKITVTRKSEEDMKQRQVILKLDREPLAILMFGESVTRAVAAGPHRLLANNTWNKDTLDFEVAAGEHLTFRIVNRAGRFTYFLAALGAGPMYVSIERAD